jgi:hypothetical protein
MSSPADWQTSANASSGAHTYVSFTHTEKLRRRRITAQSIEEAIASGTIIEDYPDDPRGPSCLILGQSGAQPIHVVCGRLEAEEILIITAYQPDAAEWESDWKTRKRRMR